MASQTEHTLQPATEVAEPLRDATIPPSAATQHAMLPDTIGVPPVEPVPAKSEGTQLSSQLPNSSLSHNKLDIAERSTSPPPSLSPSLSLDTCPQLDRSVSTASSVSSVSGRSTSSRLSDGGLSVGRRRGYMRPQATVFSDSARNRDSVMSLGSIAHLQYYFARTGLLDGKGGQLFRGNSRDLGKRRSSADPRNMTRAVSMSAVESASNGLSADQETSYAVSDAGLVESPVDGEGEEADWDKDPAMFPPTVSTYNQRPIYVPPPPDLTMLRRELTEALEDALKVLKESDKCPDESQGWYEIQGLHLLDITTLAIRAAKNYYTAHTQPERLYTIKSERKIRAELYEVLEILKRLASRNFAGGVRQAEKVGILTWIVGISELIQAEIDQEKREQAEREGWSWRRGGDWTGREREREAEFLRSFVAAPQELPAWTALPPASNDGHAAADLPTPFLAFFQSGLQLVLLHNELVRKSKRPFEVIKAHHTDTAKPYRRAENLRFWLKAAEIRWELKLDVDVMGVALGKDPDAWRGFDEAILRWCRRVREEITAEWAESTREGSRKMPTLRIEPQEAAGGGGGGVELMV